MARTRYNRASRDVGITGMDTISEVLRQIPEDLRTDITARVVAAGAEPVVVAAKRYAKRSRRTGALHAAIGQIVKKYPNSATAVAIVGVKKGYYRGKSRLGSKDDRRGAESPSHYAHLVEFGHNAVVGGSSRPKYELQLVGIGKYSKKGNELKRWKRGKVIEVAKGKTVGWVPPKPFLRPALLTTRQLVTAAMHKQLERSIKNTRKRLIRIGAHAA